VGEVRPVGKCPTVWLESAASQVLILPLQPAPCCALVFLPTPAGMSRAHLSGDLPEILNRLGRDTEVAMRVHGMFGGSTERDLPTPT
jgi:hypothetical protein